jgi:hypothetical protein
MNKFTPPESWADRKLASLKARGQSKDREYVFLTSCISARGEDIDAMTDGASDIETTYAEMAKHCDLSRFEAELGYGEDTGLELKNDWHVSYWKSTYRGCPCYYLDHSRIEYIWVKTADWPLSMKRELLFTSDPGHGWLEVPRAELEKLGILKEITSFSYELGGEVFLEEDQDAGTYLKALDARSIPRPSIKEEYVEATPIRGYDHFQP